MLEDVKKILRITSNAFDTEVQDLIDAAKIDLQESGVSTIKANDETDPLIRRAVFLYAKFSFGYDNPEAERFLTSYSMLKDHLALSSDYGEVYPYETP